jgi:hypothetical protein
MRSLTSREREPSSASRANSTSDATLEIQMRIGHHLPATELFHGAFDMLAAVAILERFGSTPGTLPPSFARCCLFSELRRLSSFAPSPMCESRDEDHPDEGRERQLSRL